MEKDFCSGPDDEEDEFDEAIDDLELDEMD